MREWLECTVVTAMAVVVLELALRVGASAAAWIARR
jgi:hypothetical protein